MQEVPRVWKKGDSKIPKDAVYVGRPSEFGNPFTMRNEKDRDLVCDSFYDYLMADLDLQKSVKLKLKGKHLVCFCAPKRCHADALLKLANE